MREGVRVQRKQYFDYELSTIPKLKILKSGLENCFVNGLENEQIAVKIFPNRDNTHGEELLQPMKGDGYDFIKIELNGYIGNPK